jgi:uncharacterized SAM-binding protein YcdF (DUF218 family)
VPSRRALADADRVVPARRLRPRRLGGGLAFALLMLSGVGVVSWLRIWRAGRRDLAAPADAIIVFGAAVWPSGPSTTLRLRTLHAADLYRRGVAPRVVCSGGSSGGRSEPDVMAELLRAHGVPVSAIVLDENGVTTRATFDSVVVLGCGEWRRIVAVSSPYHVFRIVAEGRRHGITALPSPARRSATPQGRIAALRLLTWDARQYAREVVAVWAYRLPRGRA